MATRRWLGAALPLAQIETITVANTWAANDTLTITCNGRDITLTVGATATTAQVATELAAALSSTSSTLGTGYTVTERGPNVAEFRDFCSGDTVPTVSGSTVILTGRTKGKPFTISVSESTAGSGTVSTTTTRAATGPNHFDNVDNWSGGAVPVDSDDIVFDSGDVSCLYALSQSSVSPASITITQGYTGKIGLADINQDESSYFYPEYRNQYLALGTSGDAVNQALTIGGGEGTGSARIKIDSGSGQCTGVILNSGTSERTGVPAILWKGTHASNTLSVSKGSVGVAFYAGETATVATLSVGYRTNQSGDATVVMGSGCTLTTVNQSGGSLDTNSAVTTMNQRGGTWNHIAGAVTTANLDGGACRYRSTGTLTTVVVGVAELDFRQDPRSRTVTNCDLNKGATLRDPGNTVTFTNGIDLNRCTTNDVTLDLRSHVRLTLGTPS